MNNLESIVAENACANEPIQFCNGIQPHGLLIVADANLIIRHVAGNVETQLGIPNVIGRPLVDLLGRILTVSIASLDNIPTGGMIGQLRTSTDIFDVFVHRAGDYYLVEIEDSFTEEMIPPSGLITDHIADSSIRAEKALTFSEVCQQAAVAFRDLTGYDRVMVYRFADDGTGIVIGESKRDDLNSFMNHRFPASDIPAQARALYCRNVYRSIPNVDYTPQMLRPAWTQAYPLDMSDVNLRSVSPIHIQYLKNMGVAASMSCSIIRDGKLWGLIAAHHLKPRRLSYTLRSACRLMTENFSRQIKVLEEAERVRLHYEIQKHEANIVRLLTSEGTIDDVFSDDIMNEIRLLISADGLAILRNDSLIVSGFCPTESDIRKLASWLLTKSPQTIFSTDNLQSHYPESADFSQMPHGGIMSLPISANDEWMVIWFRAEQIETINWAGNPHKEVPTNPLIPLTPRYSFETWAETVRGHSLKWTSFELDSVTRMRAKLASGKRFDQLTEKLDSILQSIPVHRPMEAAKDILKEKKSKFNIFKKK